jgi:hypothetical protein
MIKSKFLFLSLIISLGSFSQKNTTEISFSHTYDNRYEKSAYLGIIWNKKTGKNKIFYAKDLANYDFKGHSKWEILPEQLAPIVDKRGEIMFKSLTCLAPNGEYYYKRDEKNRFLAFNTFTGKAMIFEYTGKTPAFKLIDKVLSESKYKSPKGGKVMWDVDYEYKIEGKPKYHYIQWNTLTGKNSLKDLGSELTLDPTKDGEFMITHGVTRDGVKDYIMYTTKSLKAYTRNLGWIDLKNQLDITPEKANYTVLLDLAKKKPENYKNSKPERREVMIFEANFKSNTIGLLGNKDQCFFGYDDLTIPANKYADLRTSTGEIGVCQMADAEDRKIEYLVWNKETGKFKLFTFDRTWKELAFKTTVNVNENLLLKKVGVPAKMSK